jgi:transposase-like protein
VEKLQPSERIRKELEQLMNGSEESSDILARLVKSSVGLVIQRVLDQEATDYLGERCSGETKGYRNGYEPKRVKTAEGSVEVEIPQVRGTTPFKSAFLSKLQQMSPALKRLVVEMYSRGLSTRDIEEMLRDEDSGELFISKAAVRELTEALWEE